MTSNTSCMDAICFWKKMKKNCVSVELHKTDKLAYT